MFKTALVFAVLAVPAHAGVTPTEFDSGPVNEGWTQVLQFCEPIVEASGGLYIQELNMDACPKAGEGAQDTYRKEIEEYNGSPAWFLEFRIETSGNSEDISFGGPTVLATANSFGIIYHITVASDQVKLLRDVGLPILFFELEPEMPHTIRLELRENPVPMYRWYIDGVLVDDGQAEGGFPADNSRITWQGKSFEFETLNQWHYIRYGDIPIDASGDFDSDGEVDDFEVFYFDECMSESGADVDAGPGCRWADMDSDTDVDCDDYDLFADAWTAPGNPPTIGPCAVGQIIPATSDWGVAVLALLTLTAATLLYRPRRAHLAA